MIVSSISLTLSVFDVTLDCCSDFISTFWALFGFVSFCCFLKNNEKFHAILLIIIVVSILFSQKVPRPFNLELTCDIDLLIFKTKPTGSEPTWTLVS